VFEESRYFDVFVEYAKGDVDDILIMITVANRGPEEASINVLPTVWLRNRWTWDGIEKTGLIREVFGAGVSAAVSGVPAASEVAAGDLGRKWS